MPRGLRVVDVSTPANPTEVGYLTTRRVLPMDVAVSGSTVYVADWSRGLRVVDVSTPANPTEVGFYDTPGDAWDVAVSGSMAYVADRSRGLRVVDVSTPANPTEVGYFNTPGYAHGVAVSGSTVYVADGSGGLRVVDVSTPANPTEVGYFNTPGYAHGVAVSDDYIYVADGNGGLFVLRYRPPTLDLKTENDIWPPAAGQKLVATISFENDSGGPMQIKHIGVRGRRNGSDFWDIGFWSIDLDTDQTWTFEANNERPLEPGDYSFRVSYSLDGNTWTEVGNEINFTVDSGGTTSPLVDTSTSTVSVSPNTVEADGVTAGTVTITLKNGAGEPLPGKTVQLVSDRGPEDYITQPTAPTNAQGQTTAQVRSSVPGSSTIWVWVMDGGLKLDTPATITFGATTPVPDELRAGASRLVQRANSTLDTMWADSQAIVSEAGYFRGAIGADTFKLAYGIFSAVLDTYTGLADWRKAGTAANYVFPGWDSPAWASPAVCKISNAFIKDISNTFGDERWQQLGQLALRGGLYFLTAQKDNTCLGDLKADLVVDSWNIGNLVMTHLEKPLAEWPIKKVINDARTEMQIHLDRVNATQIPPLTAQEVDSYKGDLTARELAFVVYEQRLRDARLTLESIHQVNSQSSGDVLQTTLRLSAKGLAVYAFDGAGQVLVGLPLGAFDTYMNSNALNESLLGALTANSMLIKSAPEAINGVKETTVKGINLITDGQSPCTPEGEISDVRHFSAGKQSMLFFWTERSSYTTLKIRNTGDCEATYQAISRYLAQTTRLNVPWAELWMQDEAQLTLAPGQSGYVKIEYKIDQYGYSPREQQSLPGIGTVPATTMNIDLMAVNNTGSFWVDHENNTWNPVREFVSGLAVAGDVGVASTATTIDDPLVVVAGSVLGEPYQTAHLWMNNPFTATVAITVTQPLPAQVTAVINAGSGQENGDDMVYSGLVTPLATEGFTFTFETSVAPGEIVTLPPATLEVVSPITPGEVLSFTTEATSFEIPRNLTIQRVTPDWVPPDTSGTVVVTATHFLTTTLTGSFVISITDYSESTIWSGSQALSLTGVQSQTLTYALPTTLTIGDYLINGIVNSHGTHETLFSDPMSVGAYPPTLLVSASPVAVDGTVSPGTTLTYTVQVTNTAEIALSNVVITSGVPVSTTVSSISDGGSQVGKVISWTIGSLAAGAGRTLTFAVVIPEDYVIDDGQYMLCSAHLQSAESPSVDSPVNIVLVYQSSSTSSVYLPAVLKGN
jgi:uncharacterized repeat protein (TIGR01451 family)